ncbi:MAG: sigma 54-interacting transcriptional regulator [Deltaproteobacteria bacterium]|nr:sigma 54-interacting transcriptional regulator [Deltaproteobacteria bacterium]
MKETINTLPLPVSDDQLLALASLFEGEFSIDWIQALSGSKATHILKAFDEFNLNCILKKHDLGIFSFADTRKKRAYRESLPAEIRENLHRRIADLFLSEDIIDEGLPRAADQLLHVTNNLEGCGLLRRAGDQFRRNGQSAQALSCYEKAIGDLGNLKGVEADTLFIECVIGYSKDHRAIHRLDQLISYLHEALERAEKLNNQKLQALILMHLASNVFIEQNNEDAQTYLNRGFALAEKISDPDVERAVITGTIISHFYSGHYKDAVKIYETYEPLFTAKYPLHRLSLRMGVLMGISYAGIGQVSQGLGLLDGIRVHSQEIKDHDTAATAAVDMGLVLMETGRTEEAIRLLSDTMADSRGCSEFTRCFGLYYLAWCYFREGDPKKSKECLIKALNKSDKYNYSIRFLPNFTDMCLAMEQGDYPPVTGISPMKAIRSSLESTNMITRGVAHRCLATIKSQNQSRGGRLKHLTQSLALLEESGYVTEIAKTKFELGRYYLEINDIVGAEKTVAEAAKTAYQVNPKLIPEDLEHLIRDLRIKDNLLEEILNLGQEVVALRDTQEVVQHIFSTVNRITGAERGAIFLKNNDSPSIMTRLWAAKNLTSNDIALPEFSASLDMINRAAETGRADIQTDSKGRRQTDPETNQIKSRICVPLSVRGRNIGVLYHDNRFFNSTFKKQDIKVLSYFASLAAIALDNAQAYEEIRRLNQRLHEENLYLEEQQSENLHFDDFVAVSPAIKRVLSMVERVAGTLSTVLILGETGVGKEMIARAIHQHSSRRDKPFIKVHCSAFPESLIPSELFGHERGAFTGAIERRIGRFELADGGTMFLDEIGDVPMEVQVRLLRVLQTKGFERVGGRETIHSDFRLIVATNRDLTEEVAAGRFRSDLFYRLNVFPIAVPPLRERKEDIAPLAGYFLRVYAEKMGKSFKGFPEKEINKLLSYHWPGNVRELENIIERGVILNTGGLFRIPELTGETAGSPAAGRMTIKEMERRFIIEALEKTNWKIYGPGGAAELLDLNYSTLYSRMKKLGIKQKERSA